MTTSFEINTPFINLQQLLKGANIAESGGHAKLLIDEGEVWVNNMQEFKKRKKLYPGDVVKVLNEEIKVTEKRKHAD